VDAPAPASVAPHDAATGPAPRRDVVFDVSGLNFYYGSHKALRDVTLQIYAREVTAFIGPSGCGKTTFLRCLDRMNDLVASTHLEGRVLFNGEDIYAPSVKPIELRRKVGMVFQKPNPFPKSIYENVAFAPKANGVPRGDLDGLVEESLRAAALWDEVKDKLKASAFDLSGGQQQRLCIARAVAVAPEVILMDEPCSALDPIATMHIEELLASLKERFTIVIVTHNLQQAARISDNAAFMYLGRVIEFANTEKLFSNPRSSRTSDYITGRFG
jgi:phosphate transport system ATP-binding protein